MDLSRTRRLSHPVHHRHHCHYPARQPQPSRPVRRSLHHSQLPVASYPLQAQRLIPPQSSARLPSHLALDCRSRPDPAHLPRDDSPLPHYPVPTSTCHSSSLTYRLYWPSTPGHHPDTTSPYHPCRVYTQHAPDPDRHCRQHSTTTADYHSRSSLYCATAHSCSRSADLTSDYGSRYLPINSRSVLDHSATDHSFSPNPLSSARSRHSTPRSTALLHHYSGSSSPHQGSTCHCPNSPLRHPLSSDPAQAKHPTDQTPSCHCPHQTCKALPDRLSHAPAPYPM